MTLKIGPMLALMLAVPGPVCAQGPQGGPPRPDFAALQRREADDMALLLALRPEQRPALAAYLQSFAPPPPGEDRASTGAVLPGRDTPDDDFARQLTRMTDMAARRSADDTRRITAARGFYDSLDPTQRAAFGALMRLRARLPMMGLPMMGPPMMGRP